MKGTWYKNMYQCPSCGAGLFFSPKKQKLVCHYCNNEYNMGEIKQKKNKTKAIEENNGLYSAFVYRCTQCGAELVTTDETISTFCSYCGSSALLEKRDVNKKRPDYIIPFTKTKEECQEIYKKKLKRSIFAPQNMIETQQIEKTRGIYMPYWVYTFCKNGEVKGKGEKYARRSGDYVYYDVYDISTNVDAEFFGIEHDASANYSDTLSESVGPYDINGKKDFSPEYLSGFYADSEDVESELYSDDMEIIAANYVTKVLKKDSVFKRYHNTEVKLDLDEKEVKFGLFPAYFLATKNENGDRVSYAVINGQTGKLAAEIPIDNKKLIKFSLIMAIPIFIILNLIFVFTPFKLATITLILDIISVIISKKLIKKICEKEYRNKNNETDNSGITENIETKRFISGKGIVLNLMLILFISSFFIPELTPIFFVVFCLYLIKLIKNIKETEELNSFLKSAKLKRNSLEEKLNEKAFYKRTEKEIRKAPKLLIAIIILIIIMIINPANDLYYYMGVIISIIMTIWAFADIVSFYNLLTTRKLPQLNKRGGEEYEK